MVASPWVMGDKWNDSQSRRGQKIILKISREANEEMRTKERSFLKALEELDRTDDWTQQSNNNGGKNSRGHRSSTRAKYLRRETNRKATKC